MSEEGRERYYFPPAVSMLFAGMYCTVCMCIVHEELYRKDMGNRRDKRMGKGNRRGYRESRIEGEERPSKKTGETKEGRA